MPTVKISKECHEMLKEISEALPARPPLSRIIEQAVKEFHRRVVKAEHKA